MLQKEKVIKFIRDALSEDIGRMDITTAFLIPSSANIKAGITLHSKGIVAGMPFIDIVYGILDRGVRVKFNLSEGGNVQAGKVICYIEGQAASILKGERLVLNLLGRASGIATATKRFVDIARPYGTHIFDTRKTTPNMRCIEKYAVSVGGGRNHRMGLYDQALIKDNHLSVLRELKGRSKGASIISDCVKKAKKMAEGNVKVEIEVKNIAELEEAIAAGADIIMLDNMPQEKVQEAVTIRNISGSKGKRIILEVSGNITLANVEGYAKTGVDRISVGTITHSAASLDFSLEVF